MENSATHQIDKKSLCIRVDMNMCTDRYHQHKYRHFGMDYSNNHWNLKINKKLKSRELLMIMVQISLRGYTFSDSKMLVCYRRWDISIIKNCEILAVECVLFEFKRTFGSKVMANLSKGVPKSRMHFSIFPIHVCVKTPNLFFANLLKKYCLIK